MKKKKLILSLIADDLLNERLVTGLNALGLDAGHYYLRLRETILRLMGYKKPQRNDDLHYRYMQLSQKVHHIEAHMPYASICALAQEIYSALKVRSQKG